MVYNIVIIITYLLFFSFSIVLAYYVINKWSRVISFNKLFVNDLCFLFHIRCYIFARYKSVLIVFHLYRFGIYDDECIGILLSLLWTLVICFPSTFMNWVSKNFDGLSSIFKLLIAWKTSSNSSFLVVKNIAHVPTIKQRF